eukprot:Skav220896  [mRNA]  locus=scaffold3880:107877:109417:- [translate_table: standard]
MSSATAGTIMPTVCRVFRSRPTDAPCAMARSAKLPTAKPTTACNTYGTVVRAGSSAREVPYCSEKKLGSQLSRP